MISNYLKNGIQNYILLNKPLTIPSALYIALSKTEVDADGNNITEPVGGGYSRLKIDRNDTEFTLSEDGIVKNKLMKSYKETTDVWGLCTDYAILDAESGGNTLYYGELKHARDIDVEMQLHIKPNDITITLE